MQHSQTLRPHPSRGTILLLGSLTAFGALTIDLYLPALPGIGREFGVGPAATQRTLVAFFIGVALGQLFYGPISDRIGRRPPLLFGAALYIVASLACAFATSIDALIAGRFVQALGCCSGMVIARSVVRDRFDHQDSARIFSLLTLVLAVAPMVAPSLGTFLVATLSWRWVFGVLALFGVGIGIAVFLRLDESRTPETEAKARGETPLAAYLDLIRQRRLLGYLLVGALNGATLFAYVACAPDLVIDIWAIDVKYFALVFAVVAVGIIGSSQVNRQLLLHYSSDHILGVAVLGGIAAGVLLVAAVAAGLGNLLVFALLFATLSSSGFIGSNALAGALSVDPLRSGSTSGLFGAANFAAGALAAAIAGAFHNGTALPMAAVMAISLVGAAVAYYGLAVERREPA